MFDFAWSEIALIGVVALIAIGPKDMPVAIKAISDTIKKLRRMAGEFQGHVDDMLREADLGDVKSSLDELRGLSLKRVVQKHVDPDGTLSRAFEDPFVDHKVPPVMTAHPVPTLGPPLPPSATRIDAPAFIPPSAVPLAKAPPPASPAFIPPEAALPPSGTDGI